MKLFFWCGITFLLVYRVLTLIFVLIDVMDWGLTLDPSADGYDIILVLLDVYIYSELFMN